MDDDARLRRTVARVGAALLVPLAGLLYVTVKTADPYDVGYLYHGVLGWVAAGALWGALLYLLASVVQQASGGEPAAERADGRGGEARDREESADA